MVTDINNILLMKSLIQWYKTVPNYIQWSLGSLYPLSLVFQNLFFVYLNRHSEKFGLTNI